MRRIYFFLFNNEIFFPKLKPPIGIMFKDVINLIFKNILRTLLCAFIISLFMMLVLPFAGEERPSKNAVPIGIYLGVLGLYLGLSIIYSILKSWEWYLQYLRNFGKGNYRNQYLREVNKLTNEISNNFLEAKLNKEPPGDLRKKFEMNEDQIYQSLKKDYVSKFIKKLGHIHSNNIDDKISNLENEFNLLIGDRKIFSV